jgi:hypothetical protein
MPRGLTVTVSEHAGRSVTVSKLGGGLIIIALRVTDLPIAHMSAQVSCIF